MGIECDLPARVRPPGVRGLVDALARSVSGQTPRRAAQRKRRPSSYVARVEELASSHPFPFQLHIPTQIDTTHRSQLLN